MIPYAPLARIGVVIFALIGAYVWTSRHAYNRGAEDKVAYYEPILRQAAESKIAADQRARLQEQRATQITAEMEQSHAASEKRLTDRAVSAEQRIADLLRQHTAPTTHRRVDVPTLPASAAQRSDSAPGDERDRRLAESVSVVGRQCEHDASELAEWQAWYDRQRTSLTQLAEK